MCLSVLSVRSFSFVVELIATDSFISPSSVEEFNNIAKQMKEQQEEYRKQKKFERMRKKLHKELRVQGNIRRSLTNLGSLAAPAANGSNMGTSVDGSGNNLQSNKAFNLAVPGSPAVPQIVADGETNWATEAQFDDGKLYARVFMLFKCSKYLT